MVMETKLMQDVDIIGLEQLIESHPIVVVDFWASWCSSCKTFSAVMQDVAEQEKDLCFAKMKIDDANQDVMESLGIQSVPHMMIFKQGQVVFSEAGTIPKSVLLDLLKQTKALKLEMK
jgi:thioredoxin 1